MTNYDTSGSWGFGMCFDCREYTDVIHVGELDYVCKSCNTSKSVEVEPEYERTHPRKPKRTKGKIVDLVYDIPKEAYYGRPKGYVPHRGKSRTESWKEPYQYYGDNENHVEGLANQTTWDSVVVISGMVGVVVLVVGVGAVLGAVGVVGLIGLSK